MRYDRFKHRRRSIRLKGWDYSRPGMYYVTICTKKKICLFGEINNGKMVTNLFGRIVEDGWKALEMQYFYVQLDEFQIMPNHLHGIIMYHKMADVIARVGCRGVSRNAPTYGIQTFPNQIRTLPDNKNFKRKPLGRLIGAFKTMTSKHINTINGNPGDVIWQRDMYERVIRDENELQRIRKYIKDNPSNWDDDEFNV